MNAATTARARNRLINRKFAGRLEELEARALLNAAIDVDATGRLTFRTDSAAVSALHVSEDGGVYTFAVGPTDAPIDVTGNAAGLTVAGDGTRSVAVTGPSSLQIDALTDSDSILLASAKVPVGIGLHAADVQVTVGDQADLRGLAAVPAAVAVTGSSQFANNRLIVDDRGTHSPAVPTFWDQINYYVTNVEVTKYKNFTNPTSAGFGGATYSGLASLTVEGASTSNPTPESSSGIPTVLTVRSTADGVDTRVDLTAGSNPQQLQVVSTSADAASRLTLFSGPGALLSIDSTSSPVTFRALPSTPGSGPVTVHSLLTVGAVDLDGGGGGVVYFDAQEASVSFADFSLQPDGAVVLAGYGTEGGPIRLAGFQSVGFYDVPAITTGPVVESNTFVGPAGRPFVNVVAATIRSALPGAKPADFTAQIIWGDGSPPQYGVVVADPNDPTLFDVIGSHAYGRSGSHTPGVVVNAIGVATQVLGGATISIDYRRSVGFSRDVVAVYGFPYVSVYDAAEGALYNRAEPYFNGNVSAAGARVDVYAKPSHGPRVFLGETMSDVQGQWSLISAVPLKDGQYTFQAQAFDDSAHVSSPLTPLSQPLVIDTVGPRVVSVALGPKRGRVVVKFRDLGGVHNRGTGVVADDPSSYSFDQHSSPGLGSWPIRVAAATPARWRGLQTVILQLNDGAPIPDGSYRFGIEGSQWLYFGVRDKAGNALEGGFSGRFPSRGPGAFVSQFNVVHGRASRPMMVASVASAMR